MLLAYLKASLQLNLVACRCGITGPSGASESILCSISQSNPKGAAHECSGNSFRGGVSRRFTRRPKGQSTVEYVLIIAIIVLVVLIAGPWVSSAIRNQFNTVAGAIGSGTTGENFYEPVDIPDPENGTAFAVYSEDDHSLMFYKRRGVPKVGDMFNYRRVTEVYTGFETEVYTGTWPKDDCPWFPIATEVKSVAVADVGVKPLSMAWWFNQFCYCKSFDLGNIDTSECTSLERLFSSCWSVATADLRGLGKWDTGNVQYMDACFDGMKKLTEIPDISGWSTESCVSFASVFYNCTGLRRLDISHWSNRSCKPGPQSWEYMPFGHSGGGYPDLEYVKIGARWDHVGDLLRNTNTIMKVTGADGSWYALSNGNAYSSSSVPDNKADTYYTTKALLEQVAKQN